MSAEEEQARLLPMLAGLGGFADSKVSEAAREAVEAAAIADAVLAGG